MNQKKRLVIIDSNSLIHRAFHALPPLKTRKGELVNAIYGFCLIFLKALKELKPDFVAATFDFPGPTFRHKEYKKYKAKRPKAPEELYQQIPKVKEILEAFGVPIYEKRGFEADDLIGTIANLALKKQAYPEIETIILSGDLDALQLCNKNTKVYTMRKGIKDTVLYDVGKVKERYQGLEPSQLVDFKALRGDPSDNIPGVTGIGEKTAIHLLKEFGSLDNLYREIEEGTEKSKRLKESILKKLKKYKEQAFLSKELAKIKLNAPIDFKLKDSQFGKYKIDKVSEIFKNFEFFTLLTRLPSPAAQAAGGQERLPERKLPEQKFFNLPRVTRLKNEERKEKEKTEETTEEIEKLYQEGIFSKRIFEIEKALVPIVKNMESNGVKVDLNALKELSKDLGFKIKNLEDRIYNLAGMQFNINSPQQLSEVLFRKLKIPIKGIRKTSNGAISTGAGELVKLKDVHPIVNLILEYRKLFKLKSGFCDALPKMINPEDGRIHPHFHQLGAETGRMSCSEPNLQNVPHRGEIGKEIRKCFVPKQGFKFLSVDYSQMELRIVAALSDDKKMIGFFEAGKDIHKMTAARVYNFPEEKVTGEMRSFAKTLNFAILYGMGAHALSERTGINFKDSKKFIERYFENFKGVSAFVRNLISEAREKGYVRTLFGRKRFLPEINSIDQRVKSQAERIARNFPIQGTAADICKIAMVEIARYGILDRNCKLILQIHDELLFEIKSDIIKEKAPTIKKIMENIVKLKVPLRVEIKSGDNWKELTPLY